MDTENPWDVEKAQFDRKRLEDDFRANFERLKAERLARQSEPSIKQTGKA
jgi:hypothetical protein